MTSTSKIYKQLTSILPNLNNIYSLEVVDRVSETQLQVGENSNWIIWRLKGWTMETKFNVVYPVQHRTIFVFINHVYQMCVFCNLKSSQNVLESSLRFIWIPILCRYGLYLYFISKFDSCYCLARPGIL